jgi:predicted 3-demethylubiquinone-9 3-methyltransferase (glyoxalase superfamily)
MYGPSPFISKLMGLFCSMAFELDGQAFTALNGGPVFKFNEDISFQINCKTQEEVDYYCLDRACANGLKLLKGGSSTVDGTSIPCSKQMGASLP